VVELWFKLGTVVRSAVGSWLFQIVSQQAYDMEQHLRQ
jgi:hypothetical protein